MAIDAHYPSKPTLAQVAALLRSRTVDEYGNEESGFGEDTRPTAVQAQELIDAAYDLVGLRVGRIPDTEQELIDQARSVTMLLAARMIETVYYPEQASSDESAAALYGEMYEDAIRSLESAVMDNRSTTQTGFMASIPVKGLAATTDYDYPINYEQRDLDDPLV